MRIDIKTRVIPISLDKEDNTSVFLGLQQMCEFAELLHANKNEHDYIKHKLLLWYEVLLLVSLK